MPELDWKKTDQLRMPEAYVADVGRNKSYRVEPHGTVDNPYWMVSVPVGGKSSLVPCGYPTPADAKAVAQAIHDRREANA